MRPQIPILGERHYGQQVEEKAKKYECIVEMRRLWDMPEEDRKIAMIKRQAHLNMLYEAKQRRRKPYTVKPKARGISHRRHSHWGGACNGTLCMCCLRRAGTHLVRTHDHERLDGTEYKTYDYACNRCESESLVFIPSIPRLPRRTANKGAWKRFLKQEVPVWLQMAGGIPEDFMKGVE